MSAALSSGLSASLVREAHQLVDAMWTLCEAALRDSSDYDTSCRLLALQAMAEKARGILDYDEGDA
jgi:hypothetical protein